MIEESASSTCDTEEASSDNESLDGEARTKLAALPLPKASATRKGVSSSHMEQAMTLEQIVPWHLKEDPETKGDCCARTRRNCDTSLRMS